MKINPHLFTSYMRRAFLAGYERQDKTEFMNAIVSELGPPENEETEAEFRIYSLDELKAAPDGATFISEPLGRFKIQSFNGSKVCLFDSPFIAAAGLHCSSYPFDKGIRRITAEEYAEINAGD